MHRTYTSYIADAQFVALQTSALPLLSLRAAIYSPVPFIGYAGSLTSSFDPVVLRSADLCIRSLRWYSIERLAGVGYLLTPKARF
jgi:hypothetical protein